MRYLEAENPYIICRFTTGDTVTIDIYDLSDDSKDVNGASMSEIGSTGYFKYLFNPDISVLKEYIYIADNSIEEHAGKIILGGYPDGIKDETDKIQTVDDNVDATLSDTNEIQGKLPTNNIMGSSVKTDKDDEIDNIKTETDKIQTIDNNVDWIKKVIGWLRSLL